MKRCTKCGEEKPLSEFEKEKRKKDGMSSWCLKCHNEQKRRYRAANREKMREKDHKWKAANPEKALAAARKWKATNPEKVRELNHKWRAAHPEKVREHERNHHALKKGNGGKITDAECLWLKEFYNYTCLCCERKEPEIKLELDHVIPLKLGGRNDIKNAQPLCRSCNSSKNAKHIDYRPSLVMEFA